MDFFNLLRSAEELLFELTMLIVLYPKTLWRSLRHPRQLEHKINSELGQEGGRRFDDMVSPPLCLLISVGLGGALTPGDDDTEGLTNAFGEWINQSIYNELIFSSLLFCSVPLMFCWLLLHAKRTPFNRENVRRPFYLQACLISPTALLVPALVALGIGEGASWLTTTASCLAGLIFALYMFNSTRMAMRQLDSGVLRALWLVLRAMLAAALLSFLLAMTLFDPEKLLQAP